MARGRKKSRVQRASVLLRNRRVQAGLLLVIAIVVGSVGAGLISFGAFGYANPVIDNWGTVYVVDSDGAYWNLGDSSLPIENPIITSVELEKYDYSIGDPLSFTIEITNDGIPLLTMTEQNSELTLFVDYYNNVFVYTYTVSPNLELPAGGNRVEYIIELVPVRDSYDVLTGSVGFFVAGETGDIIPPVLGAHTIDVNTSDLDGDVIFQITAEDDYGIFEVWFYMSGVVEGYGDVSASGVMDVTITPDYEILIYEMILHGSVIDFQYDMVVSYYFTAFDVAGNTDTSEIFTYTYSSDPSVPTDTTPTDTTPTDTTPTDTIPPDTEGTLIIVGVVIVVIIIFGASGKKRQ